MSVPRAPRDRRLSRHQALPKLQAGSDTSSHAQNDGTIFVTEQAESAGADRGAASPKASVFAGSAGLAILTHLEVSGSSLPDQLPGRDVPRPTHYRQDNRPDHRRWTAGYGIEPGRWTSASTACRRRNPSRFPKGTLVLLRARSPMTSETELRLQNPPTLAD